MKKGYKTKKVLDRIQALDEYRKLGAAAAHKLFQIQMSASIGTHRMVVVTKDEDGKPHVETVKDQVRMDDLLLNGEYGRDYLLIFGHAPDTRAADSILDRTFGRAIQSTDITSNGNTIETFNAEQLFKVAERVVKEHGAPAGKA